jgi:hypothetical protein
MRRREFIAGLGGAVAWPGAVRAQQSTRIVKIGYIESGSPSTSPKLLAAFRQGLRELGYVEGQNLFIERRYAEGKEERLPQLATSWFNLVWTSSSRSVRLRRLLPRRQRIKFRSCLLVAAIRSKRAWSRVYRGPVAMRPD